MSSKWTMILTATDDILIILEKLFLKFCINNFWVKNVPLKLISKI